jgi:dienelactone hydrolase
MRSLLLLLCLGLISCKNVSEKPAIESKNSISVEKQEIPNIYVVKTIIYSKDSLPIAADIYEVNNKRPTVLLCHQAGFSRGEYKDTALKLMNLGFSCIAIDQRSGREANGVINETALAAKERNLPTSYLDAKQDIEAAVDYIFEMNGHQPIVLVGSSYSATLALLIANESEKIEAVASFSPGEYFDGMDIKNAVKNSSKPIFVTSSKKESLALEELVSLIDTTYVMHYKPTVEGIHGSRALWSSTEGSDAYWKAFLSFMQKKRKNKFTLI